MRKLNLNFQQAPNQPSSVAGWLLLLAGIFMLLEMIFSYSKLLQERSALDKEIRASKLQLDVSRKTPAQQQYLEKDFEDARQIITRLSTPWESFFSGLESIKSQKVAILAIEPDMKTGVLRIEGEAKDYPAVLTFISQLRITKPFSEVFLTHHEFKRDDPQHPVVFALTMHWVKN